MGLRSVRQRRCRQEQRRRHRQLKGTGWDKSGSIHPGVGLWGSHQNAIGTTNSKGDDVATFEGGLGLGLGAEISTGFSQADGWTLWEQKKEK
ncbi:hypothetical protein [Streptomyces violascens]|uniref:hypothetical protein n=1 Tax=Streptomyces violascens TaxID=67381 RepID=UPI00167575F3|nr:hypothetical protein [Streptomyces violascens]GGU30123.1 hypothetical protein GCM10010289_59430 [Streptomyces violascens]